jgi:hypothetical protein
MRHLHAGDVEFLRAFHDSEVSRPNPVNAIAVLSRADEIGAGRPNSMTSARQIAARLSTDPVVRRVVQTVVPMAGSIWNYRDHGIRGGSVAAVIYKDRVQYAVVGDTGPHDIIGEASYATAAALGINPDPHGGGTPSGVTYIVFKNSRVSPIEDHAAAVETGEQLAKQFVGQVDAGDEGVDGD